MKTRVDHIYIFRLILRIGICHSRIYYKSEDILSTQVAHQYIFNTIKRARIGFLKIHKLVTRLSNPSVITGLAVKGASRAEMTKAVLFIFNQKRICSAV